jgi:hypothetical protein
MQVKVADDVTMLDPAAAEVARWMVSAGRHSHQSMLPWLWEVLSEDDMAHAPGELSSLCNIYSACHSHRKHVCAQASELCRFGIAVLA